MSSQRILRLQAVQSRTGLPRSTIYAEIRRGRFPQPIALGSRSVGWLESEVNEWISSRVEKTG